jgi:PAS domain S-box-containing protein
MADLVPPAPLSGPPAPVSGDGRAEPGPFLPVTRVMLVGLDQERRVVLFNGDAQAGTGYRQDEVLGTRWFDQVLRRDQFPAFLEALGTGREDAGTWTAELELFLTVRGGEERLVAWRISPFPGPGGMTALAAGLDLTLARRVMERLTASEDKFSRIFHQSPEAIDLTRTSDGVVLDCNEAFARLYGYAREEIVGRSLLPGELAIWTRPEDRDAYVRGLERHGEVSGMEATMRRRDGSTFIGLLSSSRVLIQGQNCNLAHTVDVTGMRLAEEALRRSEARFRMIAETMGEGLIVTDPEGVLTYCNPRLLAMLGFPEDQSPLGRTFFDLTANYDRQVWLQRLEERRLHRSEKYEVGLRHRDGRTVETQVSAVPLFDQGNRFAGTLGIIADVTERRRLEEQLFQAQKMEAIGHLAGGVAHDFNNQLAAIQGCAEALAETIGGERELRLARNIIQACHHSADLTGKLLAFARKGAFVPKPVDGHLLIKEVVGLLEHTLDKRIRLGARLAAERCIVNGDPNQLQNAFMNLAINARDAMPDGGVLAFETRVLELGLAEDRPAPFGLAPGAYLEVAVADTGSGMDEETLRHLFEPFFTTKGLGKGTGLGLASVYGTVKQHRGAIMAESAPGRGTRFVVLLPLSESAVQAQDAEPAAAAPASRGHILLVDDEALLAEITREFLAAMGYRVTVCRDGAEVLAHFGPSRPSIDLVILDMVMPRLGGKETFLALRAAEPEARVLLISGYSVEGEAQELLQAGARGFLQKPYSRADLARAVAGAMVRNPGPTAAG